MSFQFECACGSEKTEFTMPAVVRGWVIHFEDRCEGFDHEGYVAYTLRFEEGEHLNPVQWHRVSKIGPTA